MKITIEINQTAKARLAVEMKYAGVCTVCERQFAKVILAGVSRAMREEAQRAGAKIHEGMVDEICHPIVGRG